MTDNTQNQDNAQNQADRPHFQLLRIYAKDSSIETPHSPECFVKAWKPELKVECDSKVAKINEDQHEVSLRVTVTCTVEDSTVFICEVNQAGLFLTRNLPAEALEYLLSVSAPTVIFPYAREFIANLVNRATFPALNLNPINFDGLFRARKARQAKEAAANEPVEEAPQA